MKRRTFAWWPLGAALWVLLVGQGCNLLAGLDDVTFGTGGSSGSTGGGGATGGGGTTGGGGATGGGGTTGGGGSACTPVDDGKACTDDVCENGVPVSNLKTIGTACTEDGGAVCDGTGECVGCVDDTNCTDPQVCAAATSTCVDPACDDMKLDGSETDVDCGGSCSPALACDDLKKCVIDADCKSFVCADDGNGQLVCQIPACDDTVANGTETDVDCGGSCAPAKLCADLLGCAVAGDCESGVCKDDGSGALKCAAPACGDNVQQSGEACDDGNLVDNDGCDSNCKPSGCGNGVTTGAEQCDDGNSVDGDGCDNNCTPTGCGNGIITVGETCDDTNTANADGCSAACAPESGYTCNGAPSTCMTTCGDGIKAGAEACDDGGTAANDGCNATCAIETGWSCSGAPQSTCTPICGDGLIKGGEACDDGGTANGNGCSATCTLEPGYVCVGVPSVCMTVCGDGIKAGAEACDDANGTAGDGCTACAIDNGYACAGSPSVCAPICGDGLKKGVEACDDSNTTSGDGCSSACVVEAGFNCAGVPSVCSPICGDGLKKGAEACDDGNTTTGDGCSAVCAVEPGYTCTGTPSVCTSVCGDGVKAPSEACDDGNLANNDCCSSVCQIEAGCEVEPNGTCGGPTGTMPAFAGVPSTAQIKGNLVPAATDIDLFAFTIPGTKPVTLKLETYFGTPGTCAASGNNDTYIELRGTNCTGFLASDDDDGPGWCSLIDGSTGDTGAKNLVPGTYFADVEHSTGSTNAIGYTLLVTIVSTCGDGTIVAATEACDDGNNTAGDGCSGLCVVESGFSCTGTPSVCTNNCGNGTLQAGEVCDDGNQTAGDGCTACQVNSGYTCAGTPSVCTFTCGNGAITGNEQCDDTNTTNGDGCSSVCVVEPGYTCTGAPSTCTFTCGAGGVTGSEQCDDGNVANGDGCSSVCKWETTAEVEPNDTKANADASAVQIAGTKVIAGALSNALDKDTYKLTLAAQQTIRFEIFDTNGKDCIGMPTSTLTLLDSAFATLKTDTSGTTASGIGVCAAMVVTVPTGISYIQVGGTGVGNYLLQTRVLTSAGTETEPNDAQGQANAAPGLELFVAGVHATGADADWYELTLPNQASIRVEISEGGAGTCESNSIDTIIEVMSGAGVSLVSDDDDGRGFCSAIDGTGATPRDAAAHNLAAGTYYIKVTGYSSVADYRLGVTIR